MGEIRELRPGLKVECLAILQEVDEMFRAGTINPTGLVMGVVDDNGVIYQFTNESLSTDGALVIAQVVSHTQLNSMMGVDE